MSVGESFEQACHRVSDGTLCSWFSTAIADWALAKKYEHNAHLVPKIEQTLATLRAELQKRNLLTEDGSPKDWGMTR